MLKRFRHLLKVKTPTSETLRAAHSSRTDNLEEMRTAGRKWEENCGGDLREASSNSGVIDTNIINWDEDFSVEDPYESARRCLAKHRQIDPQGLSPIKMKHLLSEVKGYKESPSVTDAEISAVIEEWINLHQLEIEKVTFDNVALYNHQ